MKKYLACVFLVFSFACSSVFASPTLRDNKVIFGFLDAHLNRTSSATFKVTRHSVTDGQPFNIKDNDFLLASVGHFNHVYLDGLPFIDTQFDIFAGRHKSTQVVSDLQSWGYNTAGAPDKMNFAVEGTLSFNAVRGIKLTCNNIVLSQSSVGLQNRWYVFSKDGSGTYFGVNYTNIFCTDQSGKNYKFQVSTPYFYSHNGFIVADGIITPEHDLIPIPAT